MGRPESLTFGWLCHAARPRVHGGVGAPSPSAPHSPHCLGLCPLLFRVRHTSQGSHHPGKGFCDLHPSPWVFQGSTPEGEGWALVPVAGAADREGTGQEGKGALQPPQEAPWELTAEPHLPLALQTPCRLPARPPSRVGCPHWWSWVLGSGRGPAPAPAPGFQDPLLCPHVTRWWVGFVADEPVSCS